MHNQMEIIYINNWMRVICRQSGEGNLHRQSDDANLHNQMGIIYIDNWVKILLQSGEGNLHNQLRMTYTINWG